LKKTETPINSLQQLMAITAEECGELTQVCMKYLRKYDRIDQIESKYKQKLLEEVGDVYCMIDLLIDHGLVTEDEIYARSQVKREKLKIWSTLIHE
jgi:NTP pyrophosphatase (non-canonical NTP hydrolase)|tara:strand:+ start:120 stop:407 length:288 start_codon:yes stop_codon:yes gene_type:complete